MRHAISLFKHVLDQGSPTWCPRTCSKRNISMINVFTFTSINTKIVEINWANIYIRTVYQTSSPSH